MSMTIWALNMVMVLLLSMDVELRWKESFGTLADTNTTKDKQVRLLIANWKNKQIWHSISISGHAIPSPILNHKSSYALTT